MLAQPYCNDSVHAHALWNSLALMGPVHIGHGLDTKLHNGHINGNQDIAQAVVRVRLSIMAFYHCKEEKPVETEVKE